MANNVMMKCGHAANASYGDGKPVCILCLGIAEGADQIDDNPPSLENRKAKCTCCNNETFSSLSLPFFEYVKGKELDSYYCGCKGWD